jgi:hypothetical protein
MLISCRPECSANTVDSETISAVYPVSYVVRQQRAARPERRTRRTMHKHHKLWDNPRIIFLDSHRLHNLYNHFCQLWGWFSFVHFLEHVTCNFFLFPNCLTPQENSDSKCGTFDGIMMLNRDRLSAFSSTEKKTPRITNPNSPSSSFSYIATSSSHSLCSVTIAVHAGAAAAQPATRHPTPLSRPPPPPLLLLLLAPLAAQTHLHSTHKFQRQTTERTAGVGCKETGPVGTVGALPICPCVISNKICESGFLMST